MRATFGYRSRYDTDIYTMASEQLHTQGVSDTQHSEGDVAHAKEGIHVKLAPHTFTHVGPIPITDSLLATWLVMSILLVGAFAIGRTLRTIPGRLQSTVEWLFSFTLEQMESILESRVLARKFFPFIMTIFIFISFANLMKFVPGLDAIGLFDEHGVFNPLFRAVNTDLNVTLALALISFVVIEVTGVAMIGFFKYAGKFINFSSPLNFIVGIIELISEVSRLISFSFRLFGNIFAGKVLLAVIAYFVPLFVPVPMIAFEMFVGIIQGLVFALLTLLFIKMAITEPH